MRNMRSSGASPAAATVLPFVRRSAGTSPANFAQGGTSKCLWISRDVPFPLDAGDRIYSANMASALSDAGVRLSFVGCSTDASAALPASWTENPLISVHAMSGNKRGKLGALFSRLPIAAAIHATSQYRACLAEQLENDWDSIVIDSYGSGWALDACLGAIERARHAGRQVPTLVYLSHNHEESIWRSMSGQSQAGLLKRLALWQNYRKVRALEQRLTAKVDLISAITEEDAQLYARQAPGKATVTLTPGYSGAAGATRTIDASTPRRVVLVGSFRWVVKQENLRRFLTLADARFKQHGIEFDVIGDVPEELLEELRPSLQATHFHGFVDAITPYFANARLAVVPEVIGGGFKLKYLDYLFGRVPIATITEAAAGLPQAIRARMLARDDLTQLVDAIIENIDRTEQLNVMQEEAFSAAHELFDWKDRGGALRKAVEALQDRSAPASTARAAPQAGISSPRPAALETRT